MKTYSKATIALLLILSSGFVGLAQTGTLKGRVTDSITHEPIPYVNIVMESFGKMVAATYTDIDGDFTLNKIKPGYYTLKFSFIGYKPKLMQDVKVVNGETTRLDIRLNPAVVELESYEVIDYKVPLISKDVTTSSATVSYVEGVKVSEGSKSKVKNVSPIQREMGKLESDIKPGQLTASELNDFSKWELWQDIEKNDLKYFSDIWGIYPQLRYAVQVRAKDGSAVADAVVKLVNSEGILLWQARTDNTGKAELWNNLITTVKSKKLKLVVDYNNEEYTYQSPNLIKKGINVLKLPVECRTPDNIDIAFVVDATGSMGDEMQYLKAELLDIIDDVEGSNPGLSCRTSSVFYRDWNDEYVTRGSGFTTDISTTLSFIKDQEANNGGDYEEAVEEGLGQAIDSLHWSDNARARILFLLLDAPPHARPHEIEKIQACTRDAARKGIRIVPIIASGDVSSRSSSLEYLMRSIALATNGTYVFLTDHSKIGGQHAKPVTDQYDVEFLNKLIKRLIQQYTYIPPCGEAPVIKAGDTTLITNSPVIAHEIIDSTRIKAVVTPVEIVKDFTDPGVQVKPLEMPNDTLSGITQSETVEVPSKKELRLFPNPTSSRITVLIEGDIDELFLTDISGKLLRKFNTSGKTRVEIDLGDYCSGIYLLKFTDQHTSYSGKIILSR
jgi:hypothetical protein